MNDLFPRTTVAGVSLPRLLIGTNWMLGWSHTSAAADAHIKDSVTQQSICGILKVFLDNGVDAVMACCHNQTMFLDAIKQTEQSQGRKLIIIDTPIIDVGDSAQSRQNARALIRESKKNGATFCFPHHSSTEQLVNKNTGQIPRLSDYLEMIREEGLIPGLSAHMPELILFSDANDYDVETYIQLYNPLGFLMQIEIETVAKIIHNAKKPVMTIKPFAAGRTTPFVGLNFVYNTIRECDMVTIGCLTPREAAEDIEIARAAIGRYMPNLEGRTSPAKTELIRGKV